MDFESRIKTLERDVAEIRLRNKRVELDKTWETSIWRRLLVAGLTYIVMCLVMWSLGNQTFYLAAIIPTLGFVLSTFSLSILKDWWKRHQN